MKPTMVYQTDGKFAHSYFIIQNSDYMSNCFRGTVIHAGDFLYPTFRSVYEIEKYSYIGPILSEILWEQSIVERNKDDPSW